MIAAAAMIAAYAAFLILLGALSDGAVARWDRFKARRAFNRHVAEAIAVTRREGR